MTPALFLKYTKALPQASILINHRQSLAEIANNRLGPGLLNNSRFYRKSDRSIKLALTAISLAAAWTSGFKQDKYQFSDALSTSLWPDDKRPSADAAVQIGLNAAKGQNHEISAIKATTTYTGWRQSGWHFQQLNDKSDIDPVDVNQILENWYWPTVITNARSKDNAAGLAQMQSITAAIAQFLNDSFNEII